MEKFFKINVMMQIQLMEMDVLQLVLFKIHMNVIILLNLLFVFL